MPKLTNSYLKLSHKFYENILPSSVPNPQLIEFNHNLAQEIGLDVIGISKEDLAKYFSGQKIFEASQPIALAYAGHQFGNFVHQLGDGRAHLLGQINGYDIQLKGSGQTKFSRRGDGKSALGPVLREYIVSEAMHALGIPSTRALCAVSTGETVYRQFGPEPAGIFTRLADSHLRIGSFQYFAIRGENQILEDLLNYSISRHYPKIDTHLNLKEKALEFLKEFAKKQGNLIAQWSRVGFVHGVMNTDNCSIAGITIDFGPCAFLDEFKYHKVFSSIDVNGRYSFFNQLPIIQWNILRLADCLLPLIDENTEKAISIVEESLVDILDSFSSLRWQTLASKLGIENYCELDEKIIRSFLDYLEKYELDFTNSFFNLNKLHQGDQSAFVSNEDLNNFLTMWKNRVPILGDLSKINPVFVVRNHLIEKAIQDAYQGDYNLFSQILKFVNKPYEDRDEIQFLKNAPSKEERVTKTFCGT